MKVYNKGKRKVIFGKNEKGEAIVIKPEQVLDIENHTAEKLIKLYEGEIISLSDKEISSDDVLKKENEALKKEIEELKKAKEQPKKPKKAKK